MDIYAAVTDRIIAQMEQGVCPWSKPWVANGKAISHATGKPYSLLNQMLLQRPGEYITFKQCVEAGGKVKKGEKAHMVVFWKWIEEKDPNTEEVKQIPFLRYYNVFHIDQCVGISAKYTTEAHFPDGASTVETAQEIIHDYLGRENVKLTHSEGGRAFYRPSTDEIILPLFNPLFNPYLTHKKWVRLGQNESNRYKRKNPGNSVFPGLSGTFLMKLALGESKENEYPRM